MDLVLGEELGSGASSVVYKSTHPFYGKCAVKSLHPQYEACIQEELQFMKCLQGHEHFIQVYDVWNNDKNWYIAMELMDGTLYDKISGGMTIEEIEEATRQLLYAISYLHANKIIHFDLKPENIGYVVKDGVITYKILDLGTSEFFSSVYTSDFQQQLYDKQIVKTTKWYRSYETVCLGTYYVSEKVDEWSLGCIIYEMITYQPLFRQLQDSEEFDDNMIVLFDQLDIVEQFQHYDEYYTLYRIMDALLAINPDSRASANEILLQGIL